MRRLLRSDGRGRSLRPMATGREKFLRVAEAKPADAGRGIVRLDPEVMKILDLKEGDVVLILGAKATAAGVRRGYPEDANRGVIRMDGMQRRNAGVGIDDKVGLKKALARPAEKVSLAPTGPIRIMGGEEYMAQVLQGRVITRGDVLSVSVMGRKFEFVVTSFSPGADAVLVEAGTEIKIAEKPTKEEGAKVPKVDYEDIGGLGSEVRKVREMIELPLRHPELFERLGVEAPKGVLLHGPPGTGKTLLAKAVASETNANFHSISGPEIMSKFYGQSEENLRDIFKQAEENAPSIIFIDELDSIAPKRDEVTGEVERRVVAQLLALMDGLQARGKVVVIGATNRPNALDPALRRPGRFDREIEIGVPDRDGRLEILQIHTRGMPLAKDVDLPELAGFTHGYVGADMSALCKEAAMRSLRRILPEIDIQVDYVPPDVLNRLEVTRDDFLQAYRELEPSTMREVLIEKPNVRWDDIGGLDEAKQELRESIEWPLKMNKLFAHFDARLPPAVMTTRRYDRQCNVTPRDLTNRMIKLEIHTKKKPLGKDVDLEVLAKRTDKYTGAEIAAVCNEASMLAIREYALKFPKLDESALKKVSVEKRHFDAAMKKIQPQTGDASLYSRMPSRFPRSPEVS